MNETINLLKQHRSIRKFTNELVSPEQLRDIVEAAQSASTSSNMQAYSIIGITDKELRSKLAELSGHQVYVAEAPVFLVWCADLYRYDQAIKLHKDEETEPAGMTENFIVATVDAALAAQNAAIAAESLGLGIVYIGGIRNDPAEVARLLELPKGVYPVFGMCIGVPDQEPLRRPRLPLEGVYAENRYRPDKVLEAVHTYDHAHRSYMISRSQGKSGITWSEAMEAKASRNRTHMREFLSRQGFHLK
ncbi:oxygen-insensitive NADPH nitroreductase [Paenibacillus protaetiae]|uniref:Oxygen-insensitive NADPH nitroreductase n=1 Tax=Paenibacillus protaetiae TaxID=2509456 RepID=A0A4P6F3Z6_9BACL|nr:oxygen-insensitive NADPH nitroreductase [Paenibacillus protaetiae]QAY67897.1 oxygen-insensitive NADPH nitroreductase [Paenibacillus protaetiae]